MPAHFARLEFIVAGDNYKYFAASAAGSITHLAAPGVVNCRNATCIHGHT
ncbi:MAG: hypothetical protein QOH70_2025 [Blastocatellia bacterium]|jgi:hypothetical protein|nr:hypothetical protein [Blastocatellia bacterium]